MSVKWVALRDYRSIAARDVRVEPITQLVSPNGKTAWLRWRGGVSLAHGCSERSPEPLLWPP